MLNNANPAQISLLLTRPLSGSATFWNALPIELNQQLLPIISPLIEIAPLNAPTPKAQGAIFTSVHGVLNAPPGEQRIAYCVGRLCTMQANQRGWKALQMGETAAQLIHELSSSPPSMELVHFSGIHTRGNIAQKLTETGLKVQNHPVYDQRLQDLTTQAHEALRANFPLFAPIFSPRTAYQFAQQLKEYKHLHIIALSQEVAEEVRHISCEGITIASAPTRAAMMQALQMLAEQYSAP